MWDPEDGPDLSLTTDSVKLVLRRANNSAWKGCEEKKEEGGGG